MSEKTIYVCDRCGAKTEDPKGVLRLDYVEVPLIGNDDAGMEAHLCAICAEDLVNFLEAKKCGDK